MSNVSTGKVKFFDSKRGWGFILLGDGEKPEEIFVHYSAIQSDGFKTLREGDVVEFEVVTGDRGRQASKVVVREKAPKKARRVADEGDAELS